MAHRKRSRRFASDAPQPDCAARKVWVGRQNLETTYDRKLLMKSVIQLSVVVFFTFAFSSASSALVVALSNDDGWEAPGIQAMKDALEAAGHTVTLAGSLDEQSGSSAAINAVSDLVIKKEAVNEFSVALAGGTEGAEPATSALIAIGIAKTANDGVAPDLLVSGINAGANIGAATQLSGTVGGTIVAIANGLNGSLPAIGISTDEVCDEEEPPDDDLAACAAANAAHFANVASFLTDFIAHLESKPGFLAGESGLLPGGVALNINYPPLAPEDIQGVSLNKQGQTLVIGGIPLAIDFVCFACEFIEVGDSSPGGIGGAGFDPTPDVAGSDSADFLAGYITVVPIEANYTARAGTLNGFSSVINQFD
jgi:5'-nucleotidase